MSHPDPSEHAASGLAPASLPHVTFTASISAHTPAQAHAKLVAPSLSWWHHHHHPPGSGSLMLATASPCGPTWTHPLLLPHVHAHTIPFHELTRCLNDLAVSPWDSSLQRSFEESSREVRHQPSSAICGRRDARGRRWGKQYALRNATNVTGNKRLLHWPWTEVLSCGLLCSEYHASCRPTLVAHQIVDDGSGTPVRVADDRRVEPMPERGARQAIDQNSGMAWREHEIVHEWRRSDDALTEHDGETPSTARVAHGMPFGELQA